MDSGRTREYGIAELQGGVFRSKKGISMGMSSFPSEYAEYTSREEVAEFTEGAAE